MTTTTDLAQLDAAQLREKLCLQEERETAFTQSLKQAFHFTLMRDVRLPLAGIAESLTAIEAELHNDIDGTTRCRLRSALEQARAVCATIDAHAQLARTNASPALEIAAQGVSVEYLIDLSVECVRPEAALRGIEIAIEVEPNAPRLHADQLQCARALTSLLAYAIEQTSDGGFVQLKTRKSGCKTNQIDKTTVDKTEPHKLETHKLETHAAMSLNFFMIDIIYQSENAAEDFVSSESLWQATSSNKRINTNLNLALAAHIIKAHHGTFDFNNNKSGETIYTLRLPCNAC